ncbi:MULTISPECIES: ATP-binding protein [Actinomadura]|uniref:ATP-binding protein n=1 Tax=Actinomadura yumaensis TaxID=111807 RepID=A0ABW2CQ47_9ACTN|nr:ATP-binding protein [Actinomadura sp. J1-007]MWK36749.1 ATP-binding protein [Actinomadura sp. J1-007]
MCTTAGPEAGERLSLVDAGVAAAAMARSFTMDEMVRAGASVLLGEDAQLVVSELVSNAVKHAPGPTALYVAASPETVILEVWDQGTGLPRVRVPSLEDDSGRGLNIINELSGHRLSWKRHADGCKSVRVVLGAG